jgi:putative SOS response-associated peptidase YedK
MCNLYRMDLSADQLALKFDAINAAEGSNAGALVYPGYPGLVVAEGKVRQMTWGFPLVLKSKKTGLPLKPKPVNNARTDKLLEQRGLWKPSFEARRCLIPATKFCEAEGEKGRMTRTWISVHGEEVFACAGIWRDSDEWGPVYSMVMTDPCPSTADVHDRMPVILAPDDYEAWSGASAEAAHRLCVPWTGDCAIDRTQEPWFQRAVN